MEHETELLDMRPLLLKRFVWDIFPHDDFEVIGEVQKQLGLVPDHDDGLEVEHEASDTRMNRVAPLSNALRTLSSLAAEVVGAYVGAAIGDDDEDDESEVPEDFLEVFNRQNAEIIYDSAYAIVSHLMATGVLEYGKKVRTGGDN